MLGKQTDLIEGNIFKALLVFAVPLLIGNLFQQLYNTADSYVVGNFVDTNALAAVGASASVIQMLVGFFMGLSVGAGVVIAQYFGAGQKEKMSQAVHRCGYCVDSPASAGYWCTAGGAAAFYPLSDHLLCRHYVPSVL